MNGKYKEPPVGGDNVAEVNPANASAANGSADRVGFLLMPSFSMLSLGAVLEPLRMANRLRLTDRYE